MADHVTSAVRQRVLEDVAERICAIDLPRTVLVGIDGIDGAGKSTFGDELQSILEAAGRTVIRGTVDRFHRPRVERYRLGKGSPEGFYRESYDYPTLRRLLLDPLLAADDREIVREAYDVDRDEPIAPTPEAIPARAILLFDGLFLHRPELRDCWDFSVFLRVEWPRNHHLRVLREAGPVDPTEGRFRRYHEGQNLYFAECSPWEHADVVIDNHDLAVPFVVDI